MKSTLPPMQFLKKTRPMRLAPLVAFALASITTTAESHEFWIDPVEFVIAPGEAILADIRVGENLEGVSLVYNENGLRRADVVSGEGAVPVTSRLGDRPAITGPTAPGLNTVVVLTGFNRLTYDTFEMFEGFVDHKDARWAIDTHRARGLPETGFMEVFSRYAKSLVAVGDGAGADRALGLDVELIALANPYTADLSAGLPVELQYRRAPLADAQIEVFEKAPDGSVVVTLLRTDEAGEVLIPVKPGHRYLIDHVVLREPEPGLVEASGGAVWESLWASLTFAVPN